MTKDDRKELINILIRLIDDDNILTQRERRDILERVCGKLGGWSVEKYLKNTKNNRKLKIKRGTNTENNEYTGVCGELTMDTDENTIRLHDGETVGGLTMARADAIPNAEAIAVVTRPNPANKISITTKLNDTFTCPSDGYITIRIYGNGSAARLCYASSLTSIGGDNMAYGATNPSDNGACIYQYRVQQGEILTCIRSEGHSRFCDFTPVFGG